MKALSRSSLSRRLSAALNALGAFPGHTAMVFNILSVWKRASAEAMAYGLAWYEAARAFAQALAERWGLTLAQACAVVAVLSPQLRWEANKAAAERVAARLLPHGVLKSNVAKGLAIAHGAEIMDVIGGPKVHAFFANLFSPCSDAVTVDVWAARVAGMPETLSLTAPRYRAIAAAYVEAAHAVGVLPHQMQAVTWCVARGSHA